MREIVRTGRGSQLQHLKQLVEYITVMDTRIGYPNEHLAGDIDREAKSPLYATAVGLVLNSLSNQVKVIDTDPNDKMDSTSETESGKIIHNSVERRGFFDKWAEKFKEFLDKAE